MRYREVKPSDHRTFLKPLLYVMDVSKTSQRRPVLIGENTVVSLQLVAALLQINVYSLF